MGNPVVWFEIRSPDVERAKEFYGLMFGWKFAEFEGYREDGYWLISTQDGTVTGGLSQAASPPTEHGDPGVTLYVQVESLEGAVEGAKVLGATLERAPSRIAEGAGSSALMRDPNGCLLGLWSPETA